MLPAHCKLHQELRSGITWTTPYLLVTVVMAFSNQYYTIQHYKLFLPKNQIPLKYILPFPPFVGNVYPGP